MDLTLLRGSKRPCESVRAISKTRRDSIYDNSFRSKNINIQIIQIIGDTVASNVPGETRKAISFDYSFISGSIENFFVDSSFPRLLRSLRRY